MIKHLPRFRFDCERCKYNWNCGYTCQCDLRRQVPTIPDPPEEIKLAVDTARKIVGCTPEQWDEV